MPKPNFEEIYRLAAAALDLDSPERGRFLAEHCGADTQLRAEVNALMAETDADLDEDRFEVIATSIRSQLHQLATDAEEGEEDDLGPTPDSIGPFDILGYIGKGGMGVVYEARQSTPERTVALKVLSPSCLSERAIERFQLESAALARLQHRGIAQVYLTGTANLGRGEQPYFAMERIHGESLIDHIQTHHLDLRQRVRLLAELCDAVDHAHGRGVIHRDIKPDNVIVDSHGQPKLLDFGIASLADNAPLTPAMVDGRGEYMGTMGYMAPEQVRDIRGQVGVHTDIFALGAVGFEMLTGRLPRELAGLSLTQTLAAIGKLDAMPLATALPSVPRDLDTIINKALETRPQDRFGSAAALASDLRRFLGQYPIAARTPSRRDWAWKFALRNRALVAGTLATIFVLLLGIVVSSLEAQKARQQTRIAEQQTALTEEARVRARANLYYSEMQLGSAAAMTARGYKRAAELASHWKPKEGEQDLRGWEWSYLNSLGEGAPLTLAAEESPTWATWHPDGVHLAVAGSDGFSIYNSTTGERERHWNPGPSDLQGDPLGVSWSPDAGRICLVGNGYGMVYDLVSNRPVWSREGHFSAQHAWALDGKSLWMAIDSRVTHLEAANGNTLLELKDAGVGQAGVTLGPDGTFPITGIGEIEIHNALGQKIQDNLIGHFNTINSLAAHPTRNLLASAGYDRIFRVWDLDSGLPLFESPAGAHVLRDVRFNPTGERIAVGNDEGGVELWDWARGTRLSILPWHSRRVTRVEWNADSSKLLTVAFGEAVHVHRTQRALPYHRLSVLESRSKSSMALVSWGFDDQTLLVSDNRKSEIWNVVSGKRIRKFVGGRGIWGLDGKLLAHHTTDVWTLRDGSSHEELESLSHATRPWSGTSNFDPKSGRLALDHETGLWILASGSRIRIADSTGAYGLVWAPDGQNILTHTRSGSLHLYSVPDGTVLKERLSPNGPKLYDVAYSPDGKWIACAHEDAIIRIRDAKDFRLLFELHGHVGPVRALDWSPDGNRLASGSEDFAVNLWDVKNRRLAAAFPTQGIVRDVTWRQDGGALAAITADRILHVWDATYAE